MMLREVIPIEMRKNFAYPAIAGLLAVAGHASNLNIDYNSLGSGVTAANISVAAADPQTSGYVTLNLNPTALTLLQGVSGGEIVFGGAVNISNPSIEVDLWGYTGGSPSPELVINGNQIVTATGSGWCGIQQGCNNTDDQAIDNLYAGNIVGYDTIRDWYAFQVPVGTITSASLSLWSDSQNFGATQDFTGTYTASVVLPASSAPEPGSVYGFVGGVALMLGIARRKMSRKV